MTTTTSKLVRGHNVPLAITASLILTSFATAQRSAHGPSSTPPTGPTIKGVVVTPQNMLRFPYGTQKFEYMKAGDPITMVPGWEITGTGSVSATIAAASSSTPSFSSRSRRWVQVDDQGAMAGDGFRTPPITSPDPWDYSWSFQLRVDAPPTPGSYPVLGVQHDTSSGYQDAWGIQLTETGANLFVTNIWGTPDTAPLFTFGSGAEVGQWIQVRMSASLETNRLEAWVNGVKVARLGMRPKATTVVERQRFSYHGQGVGNVAVLVLDDINVAFGSGVCKEDILVDFEADEDGTPFVDGQDISSPTEYGDHLTINGSGPNNGSAIFDSSNPGPNNPSQDLDLLVNQGNVLILQNNTGVNSNLQTTSGIYDFPNDDADGGVHTFAFDRPLQPISIDLIDVDAFPNEGIIITLTDFAGRTRTYTVPTNWTGDLTNSEPGVGTLDLTTLAAQPGFASVATAVEDPGYNGNGVSTMTVELGGSGALDNFVASVPCVELTFENEDDGDPDNVGTPLVDGQDLSTPPEFGVETAIASAGPNLGSALFDSTPGGPNDPGPDRDLLVGLGNILILQNTTAATQTVSGIFDTPNDDQDGGTIVLTFPGAVEAHYIDVIDFDEEDVDGIQIILTDSGGDTRTYTVPGGFTEDLLNDGPPAFRRLDLTTLLPQPGFLVSATAAEVGSFDADDVVSMTLSFGGPGGVDNICFCP